MIRSPHGSLCKWQTTVRSILHRHRDDGIGADTSLDMVRTRACWPRKRSFSPWLHHGATDHLGPRSRYLSDHLLECRESDARHAHLLDHHRTVTGETTHGMAIGDSLSLHGAVHLHPRHRIPHDVLKSISPGSSRQTLLDCCGTFRQSEHVTPYEDPLPSM